MNRLLDYLPHGALVDDASWRRRHYFLVIVLAIQAPALAVLGFVVVDNPLPLVLVCLTLPLVLAMGGYLAPGRRSGELFVTAGLTTSCMSWVVLSHGSIEAHFSFFVIIGFLTLYQHWVPFVWDIVFTTISHGLGSALVPQLVFNHPDAQQNPWLWSVIHGVAVLLACLGVMIFCRTTEDEQSRRAALARELSDAEIRQQEFTSELLLNLARRNQSMFGRQLDIINDLEERERDPDALAELFRLDHLATRVRRNAESLLVLSGEQPARTWSAPVSLRDVIRAGIAETEDLDRVTLVVDERPRLVGTAVADVTHMVAELVENAARFSSPTTSVTVQSRPYQRSTGAHLVIVEDTGVGMPAADLAAANTLLAGPQEVDVSASRRLGFHVVSRLAARHGIEVSLVPTPGGGVTAVITVPAALFAEPGEPTEPTVIGAGAASTRTNGTVPARTNGHRLPERPAEGTGSFPVVDGRHSWPGRDEEPGPDGHVPPDDAGDDGARRGSHRAGAARSVPDHGSDGDAHDAERAGDAGSADRSGGAEVPGPRDGDATPPATDAGSASRTGPTGTRRRLIHPLVVPPPAGDGDADGNGGGDGRTDGVVPQRAPERDTTALAPQPRRPGDAERRPPAGLPTLRRRVPQTHLAPELIRPGGAVPVGAPSGPGAAGGSEPAVGAGALDALSRYQASRDAARSAIENDGATDEGERS